MVWCRGAFNVSQSCKNVLRAQMSFEVTLINLPLAGDKCRRLVDQVRQSEWVESKIFLLGAVIRGSVSLPWLISSIPAKINERWRHHESRCSNPPVSQWLQDCLSCRQSTISTCTKVYRLSFILQIFSLTLYLYNRLSRLFDSFYPIVTTLRSGLCCRRSVCLSSVCLSVTLVHPTQGVEPFGKLSLPLCTLANLWPTYKILRR